MRLVKLTKVLRVVRALTLFTQLRILLVSVSSSVGALFWSIIFMTVVQMICSILMTQLLAKTILDSDVPMEVRLHCYEYFGSFLRSMLTMFEISLAPGAWSTVGRILIFQVDQSFSWFFLAYGWIVTFAVTRVIGALFLKQTLQAADSDPEAAMVERERKRVREKKQLKSVFTEADSDMSGSVGLDEFKAALKKPEVRTVLSMMEVDLADAELLFYILDNGDGTMDLEEFTAGVLRIRGPAKSVDTVALLAFQGRIQKRLLSLENMMAGSIGEGAMLDRTPANTESLKSTHEPAAIVDISERRCEENHKRSKPGVVDEKLDSVIEDLFTAWFPNSVPNDMTDSAEKEGALER
jgi:hypothetical protein